MMDSSASHVVARLASAVWHPARLAIFVAVALLTVSGCSGTPEAGNAVKPNGVTGPLAGGSIAGDTGAVLRSKAVPLVPAQGALWGAWVAPISGQTSAEAVAGLETLMGRQLDIVHRYEAWDDTWPSSTELTWAAGGRILFANISVRQKSGSVLAWTAVANGSQDATIDALAGRLKSFGQKLLVSFDEEPESRYHADPTTYTLASFVAAYKHLHDRLATDGVTNVAWVWNVTGYSGDESIYPNLYPGDSYVDWVAWDPYNWYNCSVNTTNVWQSFDSIVQPFYDWVSAGKLSSGSVTKPMMLAEYGTVEHNATPTKGQWFTDEVSALSNRPNLKAVVYFDENKDCNWPITTSQASITGFATAGLNCYVNTVSCTATAPFAPGNVVAIGGMSSATVFWSAPTSNGGAAITSYTATAYDANQIAQGTVTVTGTPPATRAALSGLVNGSAYTFKVTATNSVGTGPPSAASNAVTPGLGPFHSLVPSRILDTRVGPVPSGWSVGKALGPQGTITVPVTGQGGVPSSGVTAVILNVTVTGANASSFLTIYPAGVPRPVASSLNWAAGKTVPNLVEVAVGVNGQVAAFNGAGSTQVLMDVEGYVSSPTTTSTTAGIYTPVVPDRILDTRNGNGGFTTPVGPGATIDVQVGGRSGSAVPATGISAVALNVTATGPTASSFLTVYPTGASRPSASNLNFVAGQTVPNRVIVKTGTNPQTNTGGWVTIYNAAGSVNVLADLGGWFTDGTDSTATGTEFVGMLPSRLIDTRNGHGPIGPGGTLILPVVSQSGAPAMAKAVVVNVTVTSPTAPNSFLSIWPDGATRPTASDLNFVAGLTVANLVVVKVGTNASVDIYNAAGSTHVIVDLVGWYG
jgi:Fibronectin type III domain/Glycosyl hydrolase family 26